MKRNTFFPLVALTLCLAACSNEQEPATQSGIAPLTNIEITRPGEASMRSNTITTGFSDGDVLTLTYYQGTTAHPATATGEASGAGLPAERWILAPADIYLNTTGSKALEATYTPGDDQLRDVTHAQPTIYFDHLYAEANAANSKLTINPDGKASATLHFAHTRALITLNSIQHADGTDIAAYINTLHAYITDEEDTPRRLKFDLTSTLPAVIAPAGATLDSLHLVHTTSKQIFTATGSPLTLKAGKNHPLDIVLKDNTATFTLNTIADWTEEDNTNKPIEQLGYDKLIANAQDLIDFRNAVNANISGTRSWKVLQTANIDLEGIDWTPIGDNLGFRGTYNGNGYTISGLTVNTDATYAGLFGYVYNARLYNIHLRDCDITTSNSSMLSATGALTGKAEYSTISQCSSTGKVSEGRDTGGLIGYMLENQLTRSRSTCNVTNTYASGGGIAGGLVGNCGTNSIIAACSATGKATATGDIGRAGGLVGSNFSIITCCYATGVATGTTANGGLVGYNVNTTAKIYNSYATGNTDLVGVDYGTQYNSTTTPADGVILATTDGEYTDPVNIFTGGVTITEATTPFTPNRVWKVNYTLNYNHTEE